MEFLSKHPKFGQWGIQQNLELWLRCNGIHALDLAYWLNGEYKINDVEVVEGRNGAFLLTVVCQHKDKSISVLNLGNSVTGFKINCKLNFSNGNSLILNDLHNVEKAVADDRFMAYQHFTQKNLESGWEATGFGLELDAFFLEKDFPGIPRLGDALRASKICDQIMRKIWKSYPSSAL